MDPQAIPQQNTIGISGVTGGGEIDIYRYMTASPYFAGFVAYNSPEMKIFINIFQNLPNSLREYLTSEETALSIYLTGQGYNLDDEQIFEFASSIRGLIIGNIFIKDFPVALSSKLGIDDIKAGEIANKIISQTFGPIIEDVKRIQRGKFPEKIMELQKESRPSGLNQPPYKPTPQPIPSQQTPPPAPMPKPLQSSPVRPPLAMPPRPELKSAPPPTSPQQQNVRPPGQPSRSVSDIKPPIPAKPEFKIPDIGQSFSSPKLNTFQNQDKISLGDDLPKLDNKSQGASEKELEEIANTIDLRSKEEK